MFADLRFRLRALFRKKTMEQELDDELRFHLLRETDKYLRAGAPHDEAERRARLAFGGVDRIKDDARDVRGITLIDSVLQDLRYAWRGLRSKPGFTTAVVLTLGLGIGANTAMFGIVDRLLFRPPALLMTPDRVHRVYVGYTANAERTEERTIEYTRYEDLVRWTSSFERTAAVAYREVVVGIAEEARELTVGTISRSFFDFFDARPMLGRFFAPDEDQTPKGGQVAVLGYGFWQSRYAGRADVLGTKLQIGAAIYTIIGVAPPSFVGITDGRTPVAFIPITTIAFLRGGTSYFQDYNWSWMEMFVRRKPGVSIATADADLSGAFERSWEKERQMNRIPPATLARPRSFVGPVQLSRGPEASQDSRIVGWVMGVAVIVLLVACANVANLLLGRAVKRRREIALRLALGVTRRRLLQQLMTESILLAALGGAAGLALAYWGGRALHALFLSEDARAVLSDGRTVFFAAGITLGVALITGLAPAFHALRGDMSSALKAGSREGTYRRSRLRTALLVFQGALSVMLLVGAGLFVRSLANVRGVRLGYEVAPVVYIEGTLRGVTLSGAEQNALNERLLSAATGVPGVATASLTVSVPFWSNEGRSLHVPGIDSVRKLGRFMLQAGSPSYFATMGTHILRGRGIAPEDRAGAQRVVVVSESMARILWPGKDAIGQQMKISSDTTPYWTVVGVAENMRGRWLRGEPEFWYFLPIAQYAAHLGAADPYLFARVSGRAEDFVEALRRRLQQEMPGASYVTARSLRSIVAERQRSWEFGATMFVAFGTLALVLAAIGLYSVIAYAVAQRTHELGVRIALGASVSDVMRMIVGQGVAFAVAGIAIGSLIALWAGRWVEPLLFLQKARDPLVFAVVAAVLLVVAIAATLRPAFRATRVDPTVALRSD